MANISKFKNKRSFQDKSCAWIKDNRQSLQKNAWLFKQKLTLPKYQRYSNPFVIKELRKSDKLSPKSFLWTSKQPFAIHFFSSELQCLPRGDPRNLCANTRIRSLATHSFRAGKPKDRWYTKSEGEPTFIWNPSSIRDEWNFLKQERDSWI